jgi:hypothetical protein
MAGRTLTIWADLHSIHLLLDGHVLRTVASRLLPQDLAYLAMRGARQAGPEPAKAAIQQRDGKPVLAAGQAIEIDRKVHRDGHVIVDGEKYQVGTGYAGTSVTMRLDGHLMHAIAAGALAGTWPCPVTAERAARMNGACAASAPLPPPPLPAGAIAARRRVHPDGRIMVNKQPMKLGPRHAGKLVTVIIEDTCYRILHGEEELAVKPRKDTSPITRLYVRGTKIQPCCAEHALRPQMDSFYQVGGKVATIGMQSCRTYRERAMRNEGLTPDLPLGPLPASSPEDGRGAAIYELGANGDLVIT